MLKPHANLDIGGSDGASIGGRSAATARVVAVNRRAVACDVAQFGRSALDSDMPSLRDTGAQGRFREARFAFERRAKSPAVRHYYAQWILRILSTGRAEGMTDAGLARQLPFPATAVSVIVWEQPAFARLRSRGAETQGAASDHDRVRSAPSIR